MIKELCVIGHPSKLGGADTELEHQIYLWSQMGITVYICHTGGIDANLLKMKKQMLDIGCKYIQPMHWRDVKDFHCISFCNGVFLDNIAEIKKYAKSTTFVNCMTWNFEKEIKAQEEGLIDFHLYQSDHQLAKVSTKLIGKGNYHPIRFNPYFKSDLFPYHQRPQRDEFRFGRISRGDADKYGKQQLWIWETMTAPVTKKGMVLGWDSRAKKKFDRDLPEYVIGHEEGAISQQQFYEWCDVVVMTTDTFENLPRVGFEAMSSGSLLVVDNRGGWKVLVDDGYTGWLCENDREFVYKASRTAFEPLETNDMRINALKKLEANWGMENSIKSWENVFEQWKKV